MQRAERLSVRTPLVAARAPFCGVRPFAARKLRARYNDLAMLAAQVQLRARRKALAILVARFESRARQIIKSAASQYPTLYIPCEPRCCARIHLRSSIGRGLG